MCKDVFVKLNVKNINEVKQLNINLGVHDYCNGKYLMCSGKYDKSGWTIIFKAKDYEDAEYIIENTPFSMRKSIIVKNNNEEVNRINMFKYNIEKNKAATSVATLNQVS